MHLHSTHISPYSHDFFLCTTMTEHALKDRVFVQDELYEWLPGTVIELDPDNVDRVKVRIELPRNWKETTTTFKKDRNVLNKKEVWVNLNDYYNHRLPLQNVKNAAGDVAELDHIHEAAILYQLKNRHSQQLPYTRLGEIIIAVNPCQWIPELYSQEQQRHYAKTFVWQGELIFAESFIVLPMHFSRLTGNVICF